MSANFLHRLPNGAKLRPLEARIFSLTFESDQLMREITCHAVLEISAHHKDRTHTSGQAFEWWDSRDELIKDVLDQGGELDLQRLALAERLQELARKLDDGELTIDEADRIEQATRRTFNDGYILCLDFGNWGLRDLPRRIM